jgi:hypothetical protein
VIVGAAGNVPAGAVGGGSAPEVTVPDGAAGRGSGRVSTDENRELWHALSASTDRTANRVPVFEKAIPDLLRISCLRNQLQWQNIAEAIIRRNFNSAQAKILFPQGNVANMSLYRRFDP